MGAENYNVLGVMSGTSLDGVDLARIELVYNNQNWTYKIHEATTVPYNNEWLNRLKNAVDYTDEQLHTLNKEYTELLGSVIKYFINEYSISSLNGVCTHGHTILHQPHRGITLQIGNLPEIAKITQQTVICDFRVQDVELGGQGAPLVPIGDRLLFSKYDYCLNLGGFSNISFEENDNRVAYDICPVNTVLNYYANCLGKEYDAGGEFARSGKIIPEMLNELNGLDFYSAGYPKSLGFEFVKKIILPLLEKYNASYIDKLCTFTEHIAIQLAKSISDGKLLVTGGGAYNTYIMERLSKLTNCHITMPDDKTIQYKEALIFALLGVLKLRGDINVLASVTGASHDHSSGKIYWP